jgi:DNA-binding MarR family transcriptional regulator
VSGVGAGRTRGGGAETDTGGTGSAGTGSAGTGTGAAGTDAAGADPVARDVEDAVVGLISTMKRVRTRIFDAVREAVPDPTHMAVVHAVEEGPDTGEEVTVGAVARHLGVDPSHASRLVAAAIRAGLVHRVASQEDGRRSRLELTAAGIESSRRHRSFRQYILSRVMTDWSGQDRADFARLLVRFATGVERLADESGPFCAGPRPADCAGVPARTAKR